MLHEEDSNILTKRMDVTEGPRNATTGTAAPKPAPLGVVILKTVPTVIMKVMYIRKRISGVGLRYTPRGTRIVNSMKPSPGAST